MNTAISVAALAVSLLLAMTLTPEQAEELIELLSEAGVELFNLDARNPVRRKLAEMRRELEAMREVDCVSR